jgi:hypothetical protein
MENRRSFLVTAAIGGAGVALSANGANAQPAPTPTPTDTGGPHPARQPSTGKPPSPLALATAATFRTFDAQLTDDDLQKIAQAIDDNRHAGGALNPAKKPLANGDEPVTRFAAAERFA